MERLFLPNISDNKEVTACAIMNVKEINVQLNNLNGFPYNYILCLADEIIYIGYSSSIYTRLFCHKHSKNFDKIIIVEFTNKKQALFMEKKLIKQYKPKYNIQYL